MIFLSMFLRSLMVGLLALVLWIVLWAVAFPQVWPGYGDHTMLVFWSSSLTYFGYESSSLLLGCK